MPNLYVTEQGARISVEHGRILVTKRDQVLADVPQASVSEIVLVGRVGVTTPALHMLLQREIGLALLSSTGEFLGRLSPDRPSVTSRIRTSTDDQTTRAFGWRWPDRWSEPNYGTAGCAADVSRPPQEAR